MEAKIRSATKDMEIKTSDEISIIGGKVYHIHEWLALGHLRFTSSANYLNVVSSFPNTIMDYIHN